MSPVSGLRVNIFIIFYYLFWLWNDVQLQPKLPDRLFHIGVWMFASLSATLLLYFVYGKFGPRIYTYFPAKKKEKKRKARHRTDFEANRWPETGDFFWPDANPKLLS